MYFRLVAFLAAAGAAQASNTLFISSNVMTGQMWQAPHNQGGGTSGSCTVGANTVQYFNAPFHTDTTADVYSLSLYYESFQAGFVYLYQDAFNPNDPCAGIVAFGFAPVATITNIHLDANRQYVFVTSEDQLFGGGGSFQVTIHGPAGSNIEQGVVSSQPVMCFGDASHTLCPCSNESVFGGNAGCLNSLGTGARLISSGAASIANDSFVLLASQMPNGGALFLQGSTPLAGGFGTVFGDGLLCVSGTLTRLGLHFNTAGASSFPSSGDASLAQAGGVTAPGTTLTYQTWYRDAASGFCTPSTFNLSNGVSATWSP